MRKVVILGFVLLCITSISVVSVTSLERKTVSPAGITAQAAPAKPAQVEVTNFPAVQAVSGTVNLANLPAVQSVSGTVSVGNLPLDAEGNLRVTGTLPVAAPMIHFVGLTGAVPRDAVLTLNRACHQEFPGTRACTHSEIWTSIPPPPEWGGIAFVSNAGTAGLACLVFTGDVTQCDSDPHPVACCGF